MRVRRAISIPAFLALGAVVILLGERRGKFRIRTRAEPLHRLESEIDVTGRRAAWSAAWDSVALVPGSGVIPTWLAALAPGSTFPLWPAWTLTALTAVALCVSFAHLAGKWPPNRSSRNDEPAQRRPHTLVGRALVGRAITYACGG